MFTRRTGPHGQYEYIWVQPTSDTLYLQVSDSRLSGHTLAAFKTWLETNRPVVYSVLATPTDTQITDENLIGQLNDLERAGLSDTTEITVGGSLPAILNVTYFNKNLNGICGVIRKLAANS
jgi:hypothetical protein